MTFFIITSFINALSSGFCCLFILLNNIKSKPAKSFAIFFCFVALWSFFYFLSMLATEYNEAIFYSRALNTLALFIPPAFLKFCIEYTNEKNLLFRRILFLFFIIDLAILPFVNTPYFIVTMKHVLFFKFWPQAGILFHISFIQYMIIIPISLHLLRKKLIQSTRQNSHQLKILVYSLLIGFLGGGTNYCLCLNIPIAPYGNLLVCVIAFGFLYLVFKYQIMDLKITLSRGLAYTILIFLITLSYFTTTYITDSYLQRLTGYKSFLFSFLIATITALAFVPLRNYLQNLIDKFFFKKSIQEVEEENLFLRQEITQSDRLKSIAILASGMAHEIKNPLTVLKTFTEYLPKKMDDKEFLKKFTPMVAEEVTRIDNLVHELLDFAKPASPVLKPLKIKEHVQSTLDLLSNEYIKHNIKTTTDFLLPADTTVMLDPNQIRQALLNILLNAIDAMPTGGQLNIGIYSSSEGTINIKIQDSGPGIDPKDLPHIFDPFYSKKDNGTGLGLAITYEIVRNHGGKIFVESSKGKGAAFVLEFPSI